MIVSFSKLGNYGRAGNMLFEVMATLGIAERNNALASFPSWPYEGYFENKLPNSPLPDHYIPVFKELEFCYQEFDFSAIHSIPQNEQYIDLVGYFQSEKYFPSNAKQVFKFKETFLESVKTKLPDNGKKNIAIHIRRGDYQQEPYVNLYYQLPITYFINALIAIPDWRDYNIIIFSDDLPYCKVHLSCLSNVYFPELNEIETLAAGTFCEHFIISNSTFGWWLAWLGEKETSTVIHPGHLFLGRLKEENDTKDFWPERWIRYQRDGYAIDLHDLTFTIPVYHDHKDRKQNLDLGVCLLQSQFNTNIIIGEQGGNKFEYMKQWCRYIKFDEKYFHRTKMLNVMSYASKTPYIANWDADVVLPPMQVYLAVLALRGGKEMVFPYDGRFARWPRELWFKKLEKALDVGVFAGTQPKGHRGADIEDMTSVGGAVFWNKESFVRGGMENEHMISFGPEDCERNDRYTMLGFRIAQIKGYLHHINHYIGENSSKHNPFFKANHLEIDKIRKMNKEQLLEYVSGWPWLKRTYIEK